MSRISTSKMLHTRVRNECTLWHGPCLPGALGSQPLTQLLSSSSSS